MSMCQYCGEHRSNCICTPNGELGSVKVIEWVPGKWWVVKVTNRDGSYTPLSGPHGNRTQAEAAQEVL